MSSKTTLTSLHTQVNDLVALYAAMTARLDAIIAKPEATVTATKQKQKKPRVKNPDAPKRAPGAYVVFCQAERAKTPELKLTLTELGERWRALSDEQKAAFKNAPVPVVAEPVAAVVPKPTTEQLLAAAGLKSGTPVADKYLRFCTAAPEMDAATLAKRWKALSPEQKAKYNEAPSRVADDDSDESDDE